MSDWTRTNGEGGDPAVRLYERAGYRRIPDYNPDPQSNRWYEKLLPEFP